MLPPWDPITWARLYLPWFEEPETNSVVPGLAVVTNCAWQTTAFAGSGEHFRPEEALTGSHRHPCSFNNPSPLSDRCSTTQIASYLFSSMATICTLIALRPVSVSLEGH